MTSSADPSAPQYVTVARILRPRGNKGEVAAELLTDFPERLKDQREIFLTADQAAPRPVSLQSFWVDQNHPGNCVFHFAGVSTIDDAEKLRGVEVQIPWERRAILPSGSYFITDLIGCSVFGLPAAASLFRSSPCSLAEFPTLLGQVRDVYLPGEAQPGTPLLVLDTAQGELLIPLAEDICKKIDPPARRIEVFLPEGLRGLND